MTTTNLFRHPARLLAAGAASLCLSFATPAAMAGDNMDIGSIDIDFEDGEVLEKLIELDADDIADIRDELGEARDDIFDAISDIEEARQKALEDPMAAGVMKVAFSAASVAINVKAKGAFRKVYAELDKAEQDLNSGAVEVSAAEMAETQEFIAVLREELGGIEEALDALIAAMRDA